MQTPERDGGHNLRVVWLFVAALSCVCLGNISGCTGEPESCGAVGATEVSLIDHKTWTVVPLKDDPFAADLSAEVTCGAGAYKVEGGALEFDTGICNFITLTQKTTHAAKSCDELRVVFWHLPLYAGKKGAPAYAALKVGDMMLLDERIDIGPDGVIEKSFQPRFRLQRSIAAGTDVYVHVNNHGLNTWTLLSVVARR